MATVAQIASTVDELKESINEAIGHLNDQIAELEERLDAIEENGVAVRDEDGRKTRGRNMSDEDRKAVGERLQGARAKNLGLQSIEQLRALKLRPGQNPTKAQIAQVKKDFPVAKPAAKPAAKRTTTASKAAKSA